MNKPNHLKIGNKDIEHFLNYLFKLKYWLIILHFLFFFFFFSFFFRKVPSVDRSTKPSSLASSNDRLRDIIIPSKLMENFLKLAFSNTSNNTETCGILAGKLERNKLIVTHFLIPKQTGSSDSCVTHNEEDIFDFQDHHNLITLGWIHVRCFIMNSYNNFTIPCDKNLVNIIYYFSRHIHHKQHFCQVLIFIHIVLIN